MVGNFTDYSEPFAVWVCSLQADPDFAANKLHVGHEPIGKNVVFPRHLIRREKSDVRCNPDRYVGYRLICYSVKLVRLSLPIVLL